MSKATDLLSDPMFLTELDNMNISSRNLADRWKISKSFVNDHRSSSKPSKSLVDMLTGVKESEAVTEPPVPSGPRILAFDLETAPALVYTFQTFKPVIGIDQIIESSRVICWSAMWVGEDEVMFRSEFHHSREEMLSEMHRLLDEADAVVHFNGKRFDVPWIYGEFIVEGFTPPSPVIQIDLYQVIKSNARFLSNKLQYASRRLLDDSKISHSGFSLWRDCLAGDPGAWDKMREYAMKDTALLPPLLEILRPWIKNLPNAGLYAGSDRACVKCGSENIVKRGWSYSQATKFQRYFCNDCGGWSKDPKRVSTTQMRQI